MSDHPNDNLTRATCPHCDDRVRIVNPPGGDGTARVFIRHQPRGTIARPWDDSADCPGSRIDVALDDDV